MQNRKMKRRQEYVDPTPTSISVKFRRPPTLAEQVAAYIDAQRRYESGLEDLADDEDDFGTDEQDEELYSPHELVRDEMLNREMPRYQKELLDKQREAFDRELKAKIDADVAARKAAEKALRREMRKNHKEQKAQVELELQSDDSDE